MPKFSLVGEDRGLGAVGPDPLQHVVNLIPFVDPDVVVERRAQAARGGAGFAR